jgi:hypothetical protein
MQLSTLLTGGFLAGKRTYLLAILAVLTELIHWAVGDQSLGALLDHLPTMLGELSIATLRAGVAWQAAAQEPHRNEIKGLLQELLETARTAATPPPVSSEALTPTIIAVMRNSGLSEVVRHETMAVIANRIADKVASQLAVQPQEAGP